MMMDNLGFCRVGHELTEFASRGQHGAKTYAFQNAVIDSVFDWNNSTDKNYNNKKVGFCKCEGEMKLMIHVKRNCSDKQKGNEEI